MAGSTGQLRGVLRGNEPIGTDRGPAVVAVSACLLGLPCRYDGDEGGSDALRRRLEALARIGLDVRGVCPEQLGGLPTPRAPASLHGGDGKAVLLGKAQVQRNQDGGDVTDAFVRGARQARAALGEHAPVLAVLKARSPSCGVRRAWQDGEVRDGDGVFAALLRKEGVPLHDDEGFLATAAAGALAGDDEVTTEAG